MTSARLEGRKLSLSHLGICCFDLPKMVELYTGVLGMTQTEASGTGVYDYVVSVVEKKLIEQVLKACQGVQTKAATRLGINRNTLHKKIDDYGLESEAR